MTLTFLLQESSSEVKQPNKIVVVTGGTRGLGLECVRRLSGEGFEVLALGRNLSDELQQLINDGPVTFHQIDLADPTTVRQSVKEILDKTGPIWGLVNNAAIGNDGVLATMHESEIIQLINVNLTSTIILTKYVIRSMLSNGSGNVVNISSIIASTGFNGLSVYAASKAGLIGFTKSLAREVGRAKINVNSVSPGYMETDMTSGLQGEKLESVKRRSPLGRLATTADAADMVAFLMGDQAKSITGANFTVDAGSTA